MSGEEKDAFADFDSPPQPQSWDDPAPQSTGETGNETDGVGENPIPAEKKPKKREKQAEQPKRLLKRAAQVGRPANDVKRENHVGTNLTDDEYDNFQTALDGRPAAMIIRRLIVKYTKENI
ncbi:MAG: hypothetical protein PHQ35_10955 [Phycisphaerae bacterium]|nr:hypothetical protein [Phycisphaerae bacterium]